jgi:hypothetical protein
MTNRPRFESIEVKRIKGMPSRLADFEVWVAEGLISLGACPQTPIGERAALPKPLPQGVHDEPQKALRIASVRVFTQRPTV